MPVFSALLLTLPWLNPFTFGPTSSVVPLLFSWTCMALLLTALGLRGSPISQGTVLRVAAGAWLAAALLSAVIGLVQYFGFSAAFEGWVNHTSRAEAFGNLRQRNQFASLMNIGLVALLWWAAQDTAGRRARWSSVLCAAVMLGLGNAVSSSRTGFFEIILVAVLALVWGGWRKPRIVAVLAAAGLAYVLGTVTLPWLMGLDPFSGSAWSRLQAGNDACFSRLTLWGNVWHLIIQKPLFGWGWGELDYAHLVTLYPGERFCDILDNAHNLPLHLAVELGLPVALMACFGVVWGLWRGKAWRESDASRQMGWSVLAVLGLHSLLEYPLWYGPFQLAAIISLLLLWPSGRQLLARPGLCVGVGVLTLAACAYIAWDYNRISQIYRAAGERAPAYRTNTLQKLKASRLFADQVKFAELTITPLTLSNASELHTLAEEMLHFSPEARVLEILIESSVMQGLDDEAAFYLHRFRIAFPERHAQWVSKNR
jgi:O-antigen ligase